MSNRLRQYCSIFSIILFLGGVAFADVEHSHFVSASFNSTPSFQSHDCNNTEQHKPLDVRFHCVQSCRVLSLSHALAVDGVQPNLTVEYVAVNDAPSCIGSPLLISESKRGPPQS